MAALPSVQFMPPGAIPIPVMVQGHPGDHPWGSPVRRPARQQRAQRPAGGGGGGGARRRNRSQSKAKTSTREEPPAVTPLYKTRLCNFHSIGACRNGSSCSFAHGQEDMRASPDFERTSVCPVMLNNGVCDKASCRYAHNAEELRTAPGLLKTKMCSFFLNGLCVVGEACRFAHSVEELREAVLVQNSTTAIPAPPSKKSNASLWELRRNTFRAPAAAMVSLQHVEPPDNSRLEDRSPSLVCMSSRVPARSKSPPQTAQAREQTQAAPAASPSETTPATGPVQVVNKKVLVNVADDEEDFLPFIQPSAASLKPEDEPSKAKRDDVMDQSRLSFVLKATLSEHTAKLNAASRLNGRSSSPNKIPNGLRNRHIAAGESARTKVVLDIEDFAAAEISSNGDGGRGSASASSSPGTVHRRRWTKNEEGWSRPQDTCDDSGCGLQKDRSKGCSLFGQFAECAMCPRGRGSTWSAGATCSSASGVACSQPCAACNCGLKVVARNTFLTICDPKIKDEEQAGSRIRSKSS
mmetsp:Transcript_126933/g.201274  ORF Transcript_126933/g.201274 Transcript_126933/m.201274 type:complete len:523 (-) Transcript_126933:142-1710(-)